MVCGSPLDAAPKDKPQIVDKVGTSTTSAVPGVSTPAPVETASPPPPTPAAAPSAVPKAPAPVPPLDIPSAASGAEVLPPPLANEPAPGSESWQKPDTRPPAMADDFSFLQQDLDDGIPGAASAEAAGDLSSLWNDLALEDGSDEGASPVDSAGFESPPSGDDLDIDVDDIGAAPPLAAAAPVPSGGPGASPPSPFDLPGGAPPPIAAAAPPPASVPVPAPAPAPATLGDSAVADEIEIDFGGSDLGSGDDDGLDIEIDLDGADSGSVPSSILAASGLSGPESATDLAPVAPPPVPQDDADEAPEQQAIQAIATMSSSAMARKLGEMAEQLEAEGQDLRAARLWRAAALLDPLFTQASAALQRLTSQ